MPNLIDGLHVIVDGRVPAKKVESAGLHLTIDGYVNDSSVFSKEKIEELFTNLVDTLTMKMLGKPVIYEIPTNLDTFKRSQETGTFEDEGGITGVVVISTSHMSIHCWPLQNFFSLDVFSCKNFDSTDAVSVVRNTLAVVSDNVCIICRIKPKCLSSMT